MKRKLKRIVIVTRAGINYGWGHLMRSFSLGSYLSKKKNCSVKIVATGDMSVKQLPLKKKIDYFINDDKHATKKEGIILNDLSYDALIVDLLFISKERQKNYISASNGNITLFFNDLGYDYALGDIIVCPQYLNKYPKKHPKIKLLNGPKFFVVNQNILAYSKHKKAIKINANSLLFVAGGSIRQKVFERLLSLINLLKHLNLKTKFILGYAQDFDLNKYPKHKLEGIKFLENVHDIGKHINKSDLIISSSGYLKYEIAFLNTPLALFSINAHQKQLGKYFAKKSRGVYLGDIMNGNLRFISERIIKISQSFKFRKKISDYSKTIIDGRAPERIYHAIERLIR